MERTVGAFIRMTRKSRGITGTWLAKEAGVTRQAIQHMETKGGGNRLSTAMRLLKVLNLTLSDYEKYYYGE